MLSFFNGSNAHHVQPVGLSDDERQLLKTSEQASDMLSSLQHLSASSVTQGIDPVDDIKTYESQVVGKVCAEVVTSLPTLSSVQIQQAIFLRQLFVAGELAYAQWHQKMQNLFPDRMENLSASLRERLEIINV